MDAVKIIADNPVTAVAICAALVLGGVLVGFFLRRKASEQALVELLDVHDAGRMIAEKVVPTKTFKNAADHQSAYTLDSNDFAKATGRVVENDRCVGDSIRRAVFDHPMFNERADARFAHRAIGEKMEQELRFEKFRNEVGSEIRHAVSGSQTAIFAKIDLLFDKIGELQSLQMQGKK